MPNLLSSRRVFWHGPTQVKLLLALAVAVPCLHAQSPASTVMGPTSATQQPLSAQQGQGGVSVTQSTASSSAGGGVNSINSTVNVMPPYSGSVANGKASDHALALTLADALALGLRYNLGAIEQTDAVQQAEGQRTVARSTLLPNLNTGISETFERENLRTLGVSISIIPESTKFNYFDARAARLQQSVFDLVRIDNLHSASEAVKASLQQAKNTRDLIVLAVGGSYLQLNATEARLSAQQAEVENARASAKQAADRFAAGLAARVDGERAQVQLQSEQQRLRSLQADRDTQKLRLARIIGLPPGQPFLLSEDFHFTPLTDLTLDTALQRGLAARADIKAAEAGVRSAEQSLKASHAERLPNLTVDANFGAAGVTPSRHATGVYTVSGLLTIPLYEGGRIHGEIQQAEAALHRRKAQLEDTRGQVDEDVRQAFINLNAAADQVGVAKSNVTLSHDSLNQSRDRFAAGITDTVELVQAEQSAVQADDDYITAVYEHNLAKISLARAMGNAEANLPQLLRK